jgi:hypothetical protein
MYLLAMTYDSKKLVGLVDVASRHVLDMNHRNCYLLTPTKQWKWVC